MNDILSEMARGLTGTRLITVLDNDCMVLAYWESPENNVSPEALGQFIQQINGTIKAFKQTSVGSTKLDDVILSTTLGFMMLKPICDGTCFVVVDAPRTVSLGSIRTACINFAPRLEQALPGHEPLPQRDSLETTVPLNQIDQQPYESMHR